MSSGEGPIGAAKGTQPNTEALCQPPPPPLLPRANFEPLSSPPTQWVDNQSPHPHAEGFSSQGEQVPTLGRTSRHALSALAPILDVKNTIRSRSCRRSHGLICGL